MQTRRFLRRQDVYALGVSALALIALLLSPPAAAETTVSLGTSASVELTYFSSPHTITARMLSRSGSATLTPGETRRVGFGNVEFRLSAHPNPGGCASASYDDTQQLSYDVQVGSAVAHVTRSLRLRWVCSAQAQFELGAFGPVTLDLGGGDRVELSIPASIGQLRENSTSGLTSANELTLSSSQVRWTLTGSMALGRLLHTATLLSDGRVLASGGYNRSAELYNPATGVWGHIRDTLNTHRAATATLLPDGKVLVAGAGGTEWDSGISAELYDPTTSTWTATGNLVTSRFFHTATLLSDGRVLVTGGANAEYGGSVLASTELYEPATGTWTPTGSLSVARRNHTATLLQDGRVLVTGGANASEGLQASSELYDPATGTWSSVGNLNVARSNHTATLLPGGKVLVVGGGGNEWSTGASAELYDPATGGWSATHSMSMPRRSHTATLLPGGKVLVAGGYHQYTGVLYASELYDPATGAWSDTAAMNVDRYGHTATLLQDGRVLAVGGFSNHDQASAETLGTVPVARSCMELKGRSPSLGSGVYMLDPCGQGPSNYYCDMTTEGGGWTVAGWQAASATTSLGGSTWGMLGATAWSKALSCVPYTTIRVFNRTNNEGFSRTYPASTWSSTTTNMTIGTPGNAFKQGTYGPSNSLITMGCVDYSYNGGIYPQFACDSDWQTGPKGHLADYAGEFCAGGRLDYTWAWSNGTTCSYRGVPYTWGFAIR